MPKDYEYRGTWAHKYSRAYNKAKRGNLSKAQMMEKYGRFPKKNEWWLANITEKEWIDQWIKDNPKY
jgi:hypothetical protein